jgi:two-component system sensor histidine kinase KdpD
VIDIARQFIRIQLNADAAILLKDEYASARPPPSCRLPFRVETHLLPRMAQDSGNWFATAISPVSGYASLYLPLRASMRIRGVLAVAFRRPDSPICRRKTSPCSKRWPR